MRGARTGVHVGLRARRWVAWVLMVVVVLSAGVGVWSLVRPTYRMKSVGGRLTSVMVAQGVVCYERDKPVPLLGGVPLVGRLFAVRPGVEWRHPVVEWSGSVVRVSMPMWVPMVVCGGLVVVFRRWWWAVPAGLCRGCRYDLKGLRARVDDGAGGVARVVCPECGREGAE